MRPHRWLHSAAYTWAWADEGEGTYRLMRDPRELVWGLLFVLVMGGDR